MRIDASQNADVLRGYAAKDDGAARLGEVALVDGDGRIGATRDDVSSTRCSTRTPRATSRSASAYALCLDDEADIARINQSGIHVDFMIGSPEMTVTGLTANGERVPALVRGEWAV